MGVIISATGSYIPEKVVGPEYFQKVAFLNPDGTLEEKPPQEIVKKLMEITGIRERRYVREDQVTSDIATEAVKNMGLSIEELSDIVEEIIGATNYGDVNFGSTNANFVPSIASKVKANLGITDPEINAYDIVQGCPGWIKAVIDAAIKIENEYRDGILVIGAETLSRIAPPHDKDRMIYSDGAGAVFLENSDSEEGILSFSERTYASNMIRMESSFNPEIDPTKLYIKMTGNDVFRFAGKYVHEVVEDSLDLAGAGLSDVDFFVLHQANEKLDRVILRKAGLDDETIEQKMPLTINWLGNSSVATVPTLLDLLFRKKLDGYTVKEDDVIVMASVGAGMAINSVVYKVPPMEVMRTDYFSE